MSTGQYSTWRGASASCSLLILLNVPDDRSRGSRASAGHHILIKEVLLFQIVIATISVLNVPGNHSRESGASAGHHILIGEVLLFQIVVATITVLNVPGDHSQRVHGSGASAGHHILHGGALPVPGHLPVVLGESGRG